MFLSPVTFVLHLFNLKFLKKILSTAYYKGRKIISGLENNDLEVMWKERMVNFHLWQNCSISRARSEENRKNVP